MTDTHSHPSPSGIPLGGGGDPALALSEVQRRWRSDLLDQMGDFIRIPALSPAFDADWVEHGFLDQMVELAAAWLTAQRLPGAVIEILRSPGRTPLLFVDIPAQGTAAEATVLVYGHLDKQPEFQGWREGTGPWTPVFDGIRLFGRGSADDAYAVCLLGAALGALVAQGTSYPRCVAVFETGEESGSPDLAYWLGVLGDRLGQVGLVACLDSGAGDYDRLWAVTSLRGTASATLTVRVLDEGAHSGDAGGVVPSSFRVLRALLDRVESSATGEILLPELRCDIPADREDQARATAELLGASLWERFSWASSADGRVRACTEDPHEALLRRAWHPSLAVVGAEGMPPLATAGNVLRPFTSIRLSLRLPPLCGAAAALAAVGEVLTADPPYGAVVTFEPSPQVVDGWNAPPFSVELSTALNAASAACFDGAAPAFIGQGGTIPLMGLLGGLFPDAQFLACGVQGPGTNAHGPNESLHIPYTERLTASLAVVINALAL